MREPFGCAHVKRPLRVGEQRSVDAFSNESMGEQVTVPVRAHQVMVHELRALVVRILEKIVEGIDVESLSQYRRGPQGRGGPGV